MSSLVQIPDRSGWPHAVFGAFQFGSFAFAAVVSAGIDRSFDGVNVGPNPRCAKAKLAGIVRIKADTVETLDTVLIEHSMNVSNLRRNL